MTGQSKLSESISKKLISSKTEADENNDAKLQETPDQESIVVESSVHEDSPFEQAAEFDDIPKSLLEDETEAEVISITGENKSAIEAIPQNELSEEQPIRKTKPEKVRPIKKKKDKSSGGGIILPGIAILLSLSAIGFSVFTAISSDVNQANIKETISSIELSIAELVDGNQNTQQDVRELTGVVSSNTTGLESLADMNGQVLSLHKDLSKLNDQTKSLTDSITSNTKTIKTHDEKIRGLTDQVDDLNSRPIPKVTKAAPKPKRSLANKARENTVAGATVSSIDNWGMKQYVVLRDESGDWIPLLMGDRYKGWKFDGIDGERAVFKRPGRTKKLSVEG